MSQQLVFQAPFMNCCAHILHDRIVVNIGMADSCYCRHTWDKYLHLQIIYTTGPYEGSYDTSPESAPLIHNEQLGTCHPIVPCQALHISQTVGRLLFQ